MMHAALVLPDTSVGITDPSATPQPLQPVHGQAIVHDGLGVAPHFAGADRVEDGRAVGARVIQQFGVGVHLLAGQVLAGDEPRQHGAGGDAAAQLQPPATRVRRSSSVAR